VLTNSGLSAANDIQLQPRPRIKGVVRAKNDSRPLVGQPVTLYSFDVQEV